MTDVDQQIQITISRIFNCPSLYLNKELIIQFRTLMSQTPIFSKNITIFGDSNKLRLIFSLKITYNSTQTHLIVSLLNSTCQEPITFLIDLQLVKVRKMMFIREEVGQSMMQVNCNSMQRQAKDKKVQILSETKSIVDDFISQKEKLISLISGKSVSTCKSKDNFSQNLYSLLQETRQVRRLAVKKQEQIDDLQQQQNQLSRYKSLRDYMIGEHRLSLKDLKMLPTGRRSIGIFSSAEFKFITQKQE